MAKIDDVPTKVDTPVVQEQQETPAHKETEQGDKLSMLNKHIPQFTPMSNMLKQISLLPTETTTPPPASTAMQTRSKTDTPSNVAQKIVKRRLFAEEPSESKKKKA